MQSTQREHMARNGASPGQVNAHGNGSRPEEAASESGVTAQGYLRDIEPQDNLALGGSLQYPDPEDPGLWRTETPYFVSPRRSVEGLGGSLDRQVTPPWRGEMNAPLQEGQIILMPDGTTEWAAPLGTPGVDAGGFAMPGQPASLRRPSVPQAQGGNEQAAPSDPRRRRRSWEIDPEEQIFRCSFPGCDKAYSYLNHLQEHVRKKGHGKVPDMDQFRDASRRRSAAGKVPLRHANGAW
ncbi:MAG: hypothetical protein M1819_001755 [Sarea resinae]|nr:MAG: hypothetical protein M1819_001755 [Sarea resinae]